MTTMIIDLTIDQVSQIVGVPKSTLRYWETIYEVPVKRTETKRRVYPQETLDIMQRIKDLSDQGFAVKGIRMRLPGKVVSGGPPPDPSCIE